LEKYVVDIYANVTFGASGEPTLVAANSKGVASVSRSAEGVFLFTLQDNYYKLLNVQGVFDADTAGPAAPTISISDDGVTSGTVTVLTQNGGMDTDPASGEELFLQISLSNSSAL
jgi:hypothetical protein